ncbi:ABC transporter ATP-binding protein [Paenibacillus shirakamiensis]|nr:ABC transporter ATP-binding protein [Paenibacillus shirakamiensis]
MSSLAIQMQGVTKIFKGKKAVDNLDLKIERGSVTALLGPNGAGKTTIISMMLGLMNPTSGNIRLLGGDPRTRAIRGRIGAMLQDTSVIDNLKVGETINLFRSYYTQPLALEQLLLLSGLKEEQGIMASALSGGQQRRLGFALAMAGNPEILFLDEPTVGMDVRSRILFWDTVEGMASRGKTVLLTTHHLEEADQVAGRIVVVQQGQCIADGTPSSIKALASGRTISFTVGEEVTEEQLQGVPGISGIEWKGRRARLYSSDTDLLMRTLIEYSIPMQDIEIQSGGLNEAFQRLLQQDYKGIM